MWLTETLSRVSGLLGTCALLLRRVGRLDPRLEAFYLLIVVGPLRHDSHCSLQLRLLGHRVVALLSAKKKH